jgi:hypothetical protein
MKQFSEASICRGSNRSWFFDCAMISSCKPVFDNCSDNYDVERVLRKEGIIRRGMKTDTESCALVVMFSTKDGGQKFIARLNKFLVEHQNVSLDVHGNATAAVG